MGWGEGGFSFSTVKASGGGVGREVLHSLQHSLQHDDLPAHNGDGARDASVRQLG